MAILRGVARDDALAWRFRKLGLLPEGTLGRAFWAHMTSCELTFPGEPGGFNEFAVHHDLTHVVGGYDVSAGGEILVAAFTAGMMRVDPLALVFGTLLSFHLGLRIHPVAEPSHGNLDVRRAVRAFARGRASNRDLSDGWGYCKDVGTPLDAFRDTIGVRSE